MQPAGVISKKKICVFRFSALLVAAALLFASVSCAYADEQQDSRVFTQKMNADVPVFHVGGQTHVDLELTCDTFETYPMYAYASTVRINTNMLKIDAITPRKDVDISTISNVEVDGQSGWTNIIINYRSRSLSGSTWQHDETVATLTLTPLVAGNTTIATSRVNVSNATGMSRMPCTCVDLQVVIDDPLPIAVQTKQYTSASNFSLISYEGYVPAGNVPQYKNCSFAWNGSRYVALIDADDISSAFSTDFSLKKGSAELVVFGDVNDNGITNIVDAQIAYDVARGRFAEFSQLPLKGWLSCDINRDNLVDAADAYAIQTKALSHWQE